MSCRPCKAERIAERWAGARERRKVQFLTVLGAWERRRKDRARDVDHALTRAEEMVFEAANVASGRGPQDHWYELPRFFNQWVLDYGIHDDLGPRPISEEFDL